MERGRVLLSPVDSNTDSYFPPRISSSPEAEGARPSHLAAPSPLAVPNPPGAAFQITINDGAVGLDSHDQQLDVNGNNIELQPSGRRRPSLANIFTRRQSITSTRSISRAPSPSASLRFPRPPSPTPSILPCISANNIWDDIGNGSALSIEYFKSTLKRFGKSDRPEHQSCLDFSLLHFISIRHLEHLLYAELKWVNEAMDKELRSEVEDRIEELPQTVEEMERKYPERLKSIQTLLEQYATAVRNFEDMRKRPVKASYEFTFDGADEDIQRRRSTGLFSRFRRHSNTRTSGLVDLESSAPRPRSASTATERHVSEFARAATVMQAVNRFGRPIGLAQRRAARRIRLSHRSIAGVEDWERDFRLQNLNLKTQKEEKRKKQAEAFWHTVRRFAMAVAGGIALIIPVIVMTLYEGLVQCLVTTSVATFLFAIFITWYSNANEKDILAATAAYAAVLVVFVGTSLSIPTSPPPTTNSS